MDANAEMREAKEGRAVCREEEKANVQEPQWSSLNELITKNSL